MHSSEDNLHAAVIIVWHDLKQPHHLTALHTP